MDVFAVERRAVLRVHQLEEVRGESIAFMLEVFDLALVDAAVGEVAESQFGELGDRVRVRTKLSEEVEEVLSPGDETEPHVVSLSFAEPSFRTLRRAGMQIGDRGETTGYRSVTAGSRTGISRR